MKHFSCGLIYPFDAKGFNYSLQEYTLKFTEFGFCDYQKWFENTEFGPPNDDIRLMFQFAFINHYLFLPPSEIIKRILLLLVAFSYTKRFNSDKLFVYCYLHNCHLSLKIFVVCGGERLFGVIITLFKMKEDK